MLRICGDQIALLCLALAPLALAPNVAHAANWGSFNGSRIAYASGPLEEGAHSELRALIADNGDAVAVGTGELTEAYLDTVDVFYTSMLSGGTGATAGDLGTLSVQEAQAMADWLGNGGTLIVTIDSTGLDGDEFQPVYDSWVNDYGIDGLSFSAKNEGTNAPLVVHPLTSGVIAYRWVNPTSFSVGGDALLLGESDASVALLAVLEPATGFDAGGRILVAGDHNMLTDNFIGESSNATLAANMVRWAAGECGNSIVESGEACDDGNKVDDDACSNACTDDTGGTDTGGTDTGGTDTGGTDTGGTDEGSPDDGSADSTGSARTTGGADDNPIDDGLETDASAGGTVNATDGSDETGGTAQDDDGSGCSCSATSQRGPGVPVFALGLIALSWRRRRR